MVFKVMPPSITAYSIAVGIIATIANAAVSASPAHAVRMFLVIVDSFSDGTLPPTRHSERIAARTSASGENTAPVA
jgi:hypothetical protein